MTPPRFTNVTRREGGQGAAEPEVPLARLFSGAGNVIERVSRPHAQQPLALLLTLRCFILIAIRITARAPAIWPYG